MLRHSLYAAERVDEFLGHDPISQSVTFRSRANNHSLCVERISISEHSVIMAHTDKNGGPNHLKAWREFHRMTQAQLAEKVGTNANMISYLEEGQRSLSLKWLRRLAPALNTSVGFLADIDPNNADTRTMELALAVPEDKRDQVNLILESFVKDGTNN